MKLRNCSIFKPARRSKRHHPWLIAYGTGKNRKVVSGSTDYDDTAEFARKLSLRTQQASLGLIPPGEIRSDTQRRRPLSEHVQEFEQHLIACGKTAKHARQMRRYAEQSLCDSSTIDAVVVSNVQRRIAAAKGGKNRRVYAIRAFIKWGIQDRRWPEECLESIASLSRFPKGSRRSRRVLSVDDLATLISTAEASEQTRRGLSGVQRSVLYRLMVVTGLRYGEATRLRVRDIRKHSILLPATEAKNRKEATIMLPDPMLELLRSVAPTSPDSPIFSVQSNGWLMLDADLADADIPRKTNDGIFDFHSLRHECATILAAARVPLKVLQQHMRLSSVELAMDTYGHLFEEDRKVAVSIFENLFQRDDKRGGGRKTPKNMERRGIEPRFAECDAATVILLITELPTALRDRKGRPIAPRQAQRLLRSTFQRIVNAAKKRGER